MATKIRFARGGAKKRPYYRLVVADSRAARDGDFIEKLGTYNPLLAKDDATRFTFDKERIAYWISTGAQPSDRVLKLLENAGVKVPYKSSPDKSNAPKRGPKKEAKSA